MKDDRMSKARFVQEFVKSNYDDYHNTSELKYLSISGVNKELVADAEEMWDFLTEAGYGDSVPIIMDVETGELSKGFVDDGLHQGRSVEYWERNVKSTRPLIKHGGYDGMLEEELAALASAKRLREDTLRKKGERSMITVEHSVPCSYPSPKRGK